MKADVELLCRRVLDAILNGGYQGFLLTGMIVVALLFMRRASAATRHNILLFTLLLVALLPAAHLARSTSMLEIFPGFAGERREVIGKFETTARMNDSRIEADAALQFKWHGEETEVPATESSLPLLPEPAAELTATAEDKPPPFEPREQRVFLPLELSGGQSVGIVVAIAALGLLRLAFLGWELVKISWLKRKAAPPPGGFQKLFDRICGEMQLRRLPKLFVTEGRIGPCATGFWRPAVFAPRGLVSGETKNTEPILRHELAHIARGDDWASLLQQVIAAAFFFHPAVWLLSRRLNVEREIACDDHVLAALPDRKGYALLLTEFASRTAASRWTAAPAVWRNKKQLKRRIDMILNKYRNACPRAARASVGLISAAAVGMTLVGIGFAPQVAFAQSSEAALEIPEPQIAASAASAPLRQPAAAPAPVLASANGAVIAVAPALAAEPAATTPRRKARAQTAEAEDQVERRIERLERMVEQLLAREKGQKKSEVPTAQLKPRSPKVDFNFDGKEMARVQRDLERAAKEMERAASQSHQWRHEWSIDGKTSFRGDPKSLKAHRKALEAQQKALEKQLEAIEKQLDELEEAEEEAEEGAGAGAGEGEGGTRGAGKIRGGSSSPAPLIRN